MIFFPKVQIIELESLISITVHKSANPCPLSYNKLPSSGFRVPTQHSAVLCLVRNIKYSFTIQTLGIKVCLDRSYSIRWIVLLACMYIMEIALFVTIWKYAFWLSHIYTFLSSLLLLGIAWYYLREQEILFYY